MTEVLQASMTRCPVCGGSDFRPHLPALVRCGACAMVTAKVDAGEEELQALYGSGYFCGDEYADYLADKRVIQKSFRKRLATVRRHVEGGRLVDVGCAYGFFLELAQEHFTVLGYDVSEQAVEYASGVLGVPAVCADFLSDESLKASSMDVVTMWDVIEHLAEPGRFVDRSWEVLRDGGHLFLTTGDIDSWLARRQGRRWRLIHPPTHLQYFSAATIRRLLETRGFEVVRVLYPGHWRTVRQILHGLFVFGRNGRSSTVHRIASRLMPADLGIYMNTFDIMCVIARKTSERPAGSRGG